MNEVQLINLDRLGISSATQVRERFCNATITHYSERMIAGDQFPPVVVYQNGNGTFAIADGFHRIKAATLAQRKQIETIVHHGDHKDALDYALRANLTHGSRLTNADKRKAVLMALDAWPDESDRRIAERCGVDHKTVGTHRAEHVGNFPTHRQVVAIPCSVVTPSSNYADPEPVKPPELVPPMLGRGKVKLVGHKPPSKLKGKTRVRSPKLPLVAEEQQAVKEAEDKVRAMTPAAQKVFAKWIKTMFKKK
jgi:hypothetical protein